MKKKKILALVLAASMAGGMLAGCGSTSGGDETAKGDKSSGKVYYLNFKPEQADQWVELAKEYTDETGVQVDVQTAASGTYESQLKSEMAKDEAPTLFQVNGPVGLATWKDYCYDLSGSDVYKDVESDDYVLKDGDAVDGIAYVIETYGLIYNKALLNKYFELPDASIKSIDELNNFQALKTAAEEIQAHKDDLGVEGAFTSAGMDSSSDWRFKTHLANLPIYYEYKADGIDTTDAIKGTYLDNYKQIWDLYLNNSTCEPSMISSKTGDDAASEFSLGEAVFYQNGTWAYNDIKDNEVADEDMGMLQQLFCHLLLHIVKHILLLRHKCTDSTLRVTISCHLHLPVDSRRCVLIHFIQNCKFPVRWHLLTRFQLSLYHLFLKLVDHLKIDWTS